eukprot:CAMPEP_0202453532 /NCGR_PEP_ID=MMETSP1360-20130828/11488_1 /ASSEMBLY_ACC=CAM_ASM_000848 /TAXON_ID=515479 /ORGANISM="Licmophora paradoxa, Strain CCMP2313" /LENGTH=411 /DNA_ID=CAMNT_0049072657 /DNA_START=111 /DNA_END=1343 /DNA_ORIENTATION=+
MSEQSGGAGSPDGVPSSNAGNQSRRERQSRSNRNNRPRSNPFAGDPSIEFLKGYVYDVGPKSKDQFSTTTEALVNTSKETEVSGKEEVASSTAFDPNNLRFDPILDPPTPAKIDDIVKMEIWKLQLKEAHAKRNDRQDVINAAYSIVRKQCSDAQWNLVESHKDHAEVQAKMDVIGLLKLIRNALYSGATTRNSCVSAQDAMVKLFTFRQSKTMENADYLKKFKELTELVAFNGTIIGVKETRVTDMIKEIAKDKNVPTEDEYEKAKDMAQEQFHAILLIRHADKNRFGQLIAYLENSFTMGEDRYPRTVTKAYEILVNYKKFVQHAHDASEHGMSYHTKQTNNNETHVPREDQIMEEEAVAELEEPVAEEEEEQVVVYETTSGEETEMVNTTFLKKTLTQEIQITALAIP